MWYIIWISYVNFAIQALSAFVQMEICADVKIYISNTLLFSYGHILAYNKVFGSGHAESLTFWRTIQSLNYYTLRFSRVKGQHFRLKMPNCVGIVQFYKLLGLNLAEQNAAEKQLCEWQITPCTARHQLFFATSILTIAEQDSFTIYNSAGLTNSRAGGVVVSRPKMDNI